MKHCLLLFVFFIASFTSHAQLSINTPEAIVDNFFKIYDHDGLNAAVDFIYTYGDESMQESKKYVQDTLAHTIKNIGGKYLGHEFMVKKYASPSLCLYGHLVKYSLAPLRFTFVFYKPQDKWVIMNFVFDSNTISELGKASRTDFKE